MPGRAGILDHQKAMTQTIVVTCPVPFREFGQLELTSEDHTVVVAGPDGFRHELELPAVADMGKLEVELYRGYLELRTPRQGETGGSR